MERAHETSSLKYRQIAETLVKQMGECPDFVLKSQRLLAVEFGVNRLTIQHALSWMEQGGYIKRLSSRGYAAASQISAEGSEVVVGWPLWVNSYGEIDSLRTHNRMRLIESTHRKLQSYGFRLDVQCVGLPHRPNLALIRELVKKWKLVIMEPMEGDNEIFPENPFFGMMDRAILVGAIQGRKHNCICPDFYEGAKNAVRELVRLGARRILFSGRSNDPIAHQFLRSVGVESALEIHPDVEILFADGGAHFDEAYSAIKQFFSEGGECDAIIGSSVMGAIATCRVLADLGVRVPDEVQVIGISGGVLATYMVPRPTVVQTHPGLFADSIARMAVVLSHPKARPQNNILIPMQLIKGETTCEIGGVAPSSEPFVEGLRRSMKSEKSVKS